MTLITTYQSCKELIANNLEAKGVQASADEGLTTLANKILNIDTSKPIDQYADVTIFCQVVTPRDFPYMDELNNLEFRMIGKQYDKYIKYSNENSNFVYTFSHVKLDQYIIYSPNALTLFLDYPNVILANNSIIIHDIALTNTQELVVTFYIEYTVLE